MESTRPKLDEFLRVQLAYHADIAEVVSWMIQDYLFNLRDRDAALRPAASQDYRPNIRLANAFLQQEPSAQKTLLVSLVQIFSFTQYFEEVLAKRLSQITPSQAVAYIVVISDPTGQQITLDSSSGLPCFTKHSFVVSPGDHSVAVAQCKKLVTAPINESITVGCP